MCIRFESHSATPNGSQRVVGFGGCAGRARSTPRQVDADLWSDFPQGEAEISGVLAESTCCPCVQGATTFTRLLALGGRRVLGRASEYGQACGAGGACYHPK